MGLTVLRFNDADVTRDTISVLMAIEGWVERNNCLTSKETTPYPPLIRGNTTISNGITHLK
jgi:hypothetical protein